VVLSYNLKKKGEEREKKGGEERRKGDSPLSYVFRV